MFEATIAYLRDHFSAPFGTAIILGSGLGSFADQLDLQKKIFTRDIPGYPRSTVAGHQGAIIEGFLQEKKVLLFQGRIHGYEGYAPEEVILPVHIAWSFGVRSLILTNAAGGLNPRLRAGDLFLINDYIATLFAQRQFLTGNTMQAPAKRIAFDPASLELVRECARNVRITLAEGAYCYLSGPTYETRAEIAALRKMGGDVAGMSTVPEIIAAHERRMNVLALSCVTNTASTVRKKVSHEEVTQVAGTIATSFTNLLREIVTRLPSN